MKLRTLAASVLMGALSVTAMAAQPQPKKDPMAVLTPAVIQKVTDAAPAKATATPAKPRKVLVMKLTKGFYHDVIPIGAKAVEIMGKKTGAWETVITNDPKMFAADKLAEFDAVVMMSTTGEIFDGFEPAVTASLKQSLLDFVRSGKGIIGSHAATDCLYKWKEYGDMMGGYFQGHPFYDIAVKIDDPASPVNAAFNGKGFEITDEMYTFRAPYSREKLHILLSIDLANSKKIKDDVKKPGFKEKENRDDHDYAISWLKEEGKGRVFYCSFGHQHQIFWNPAILQHYVDGIQYALGDLKADATPSVKK